MTRHLLDRTPLESTALAVGYSLLGFYYAGVLIRGWFRDALDQACTWTEQRS